MSESPVPRVAPAICGAISDSGWDGEPLACAFKPGHDGAHAWASLPSFTAEDAQALADLRRGELEDASSLARLLADLAKALASLPEAERRKYAEAQESVVRARRDPLNEGRI